MTMQDLPWTEAPNSGAASAHHPPGRLLVASLLRALSASLTHWAERLLQAQAPTQPPAPELLLEFHAEAGAPEGALYVDGQLVGHLPGVQRL